MRARAGRWRCSSPSRSCPATTCSRRSQRWRTVVPTARRLVAAHWSHFLADAPALRGRPGQGQVRRLPADAARRARRGVPHRDLRAALRLGLDGRGARGRDGAHHHAGPRRPDPRDPRLPRPDGRCRTALTPDSEHGARRHGPRRRRRPALPARRALSTAISIAATSVRDVAMRDLRPPRPTSTSTRVVDLVVVGAGPAGLAAGGLRRVGGAARPSSLEAEAVGGQAGTSSMIRNYLGFPRGISGMRLAQRARNQAIRFGTQLLHRVGGHGARARRRGRAARAAHRRRRRPRPRRRDRDRRHLPQARRASVDALVGRGVNYGARDDRRPRDGGLRRGRRRRRQLRRPGRHPPGAVRPHR